MILFAEEFRMAKTPDEKTVQIKVSPELRKAIHRMALERDETVRIFILKALQQRGIAVSDGDLVDRRKVVGR
jgi:predicted transcriptional regulator